MGRTRRDTLDEDSAEELGRTLSSENFELPTDDAGGYPTEPGGIPEAGELFARAAASAETRIGSQVPLTGEREAPAADWDEDPFGSLATGAELGGRYRLERVLGRGATGVVFEASHLVIGKRVALKCLYPHHRAAPTAVERFFREARIAATVEHPNVIQVFDGGDEKETLFLAMELLEGESLGDRLERGPLPVEEAVRIFLAIMSGVAAVHERGVVHRDLKPDNIFLVSHRFQPNALPKVLDFGISKLKEPGLRELTTLGTVMGTPYYMAPEQVANTKGVDVRADVYSLGVMLYETLAGDVPYSGESVLEIFRAAELGERPALTSVRSDVSAGLARVVDRAMHGDREGRYQSMSEFADALREAGPSGATDPDSALPPVPDVRATVRDVRSQLSSSERERADSTPVRSPAPSPARREERRTVELPQMNIVERTPAWVLPSLVGAAIVSFVSLGVAIVALLL